MRKSLILFAVCFVILIFSTNSYSQGIKIGIGGGLTSIQGPDAYTETAGFSSEYHIGLKAKLSIPLFPIVPTAHVNYHFLTGEASTPIGNIETSQNILAIGVGGELALIPGPISPYFALDLSFNNFGDIEISGPGAVTISGDGGDSRMGLAVGVGAELSLMVISVDASLKYNFMNIIGKEDGEETISAIIFNVSVLF
jgi:hypothetical protein